MATLDGARCTHHAGREAVARCPACQRFFCRECITEHDRRVLCADCLRRLAATPARKASRRGDVALTAAGVAGLFVIWVLFYLAGQALLLIPSSFHEGTWWEGLWQGRL